MRTIPLLFAAALILGACSRSSPGAFSLSGSITAPARIQRRAERPNAVLFIVATNSGGIPIAVKRIINPKLPLYYRMSAKDLILPGPVWTGPLDVKVFVNFHGKLGVSMRGDLRGSHRGAVSSRERHVDIVIDGEL